MCELYREIVRVPMVVCVCWVCEREREREREREVKVKFWERSITR